MARDRTLRRLPGLGLSLVLSLVLGLAAMLLYPAPIHAAVAAFLPLLPVTLFGLVVLPLSLWRVSDPARQWVAPVLCRADRFQRPPPADLR